MKDKDKDQSEVTFRDPTTPADVLRLGREFKALRDTKGFLLFRDLLSKRYSELAISAIENRNPDYPLAYWQGRCAEIKDILLIVDLAVLNARDAVARMHEEDQYKDQEFPFQSGTGVLA